MVSAIIDEATANSGLQQLAHELMDGIGPRLVGSPKMQQAHNWAVAKYNSWNITARNEQWGEWRLIAKITRHDKLKSTTQVMEQQVLECDQHNNPVKILLITDGQPGSINVLNTRYFQ